MDVKIKWPTVSACLIFYSGSHEKAVFFLRRRLDKDVRSRTGRHTGDGNPTSGAEDAERLPGEKGVGDAGDCAREDRFGSAKLLLGELAEEGAKGEGSGEAGEKEKGSR
jgi:hypothetical protein